MPTSEFGGGFLRADSAKQSTHPSTPARVTGKSEVLHVGDIRVEIATSTGLVGVLRRTGDMAGSADERGLGLVLPSVFHPQRRVGRLRVAAEGATS